MRVSGNYCVCMCVCVNCLNTSTCTFQLENIGHITPISLLKQTLDIRSILRRHSVTSFNIILNAVLSFSLCTAVAVSCQDVSVASIQVISEPDL